MGPSIPNPKAGGNNGRLAIGGALWCEMEGCLPCGEAVVRQVLYGKRWYKANFGIDVKTVWLLDNWTHPWTYPQILKKAGIESYMYSRTISQPHNMFWWESADGSRIFAYRPLTDLHNNLPSEEKINKYLMHLNRDYGLHDGIALIGEGNHGGGAIAADVERMKQVIQERDASSPGKVKPARLSFSTPQQFTSKILENPGKLPVLGAVPW